MIMIDNFIFQNKKAVYYTLGCKLNFAETSTLGKYLSEQGIQKAGAGEKADICIVNTCSVTELADKKCRQAIRRIKKQHPDAFMIVTGCYTQLKPEEVRQMEGVDLILEKDLTKFVPSCSQDDRTRHFLKVQDGCDYYCTYCTIPFARGRSRNGKIEDLVQMAETAGKEGGKEIVLTGVNIGDFGKTTGETFFDLIQALDKAESIERFRISSIEPNLLTDKILEFVAHSQRFAPHFHIPLQAGSNEVLKLMHRKYTTEFFQSKLEKIKTILPNAFIGVDVIVGMRGETPAYFEDAKRFLEALPFSQLHVFSYSERPGTMALKIEPVVSPKEKQERSKQLLELSDRKLKEFYRSQAGTTHQVLFEHTKRGDKMHGFTENYVKVEADYSTGWINKLTTITLNNFDEETNCYRHS
ncbi:tRNA (N(6)-L-threonylcarbamoyladenosine(37)-C(2))-methylthiotransferase MtaB [Bacteroidia bacterium]|nr:tRNA (N(6)-L-threonylcarbamoyladenosine(37)-C(2))-methylthiotransferase MtaB [Bacteroidia bacterium]GHT47805.1 tRNA (N(6)-L-threonylcarbamoyladenosine(37)-C(2))-methylthiotransferase MtaB [Bacteroidia bacterium]